MPSSTSPIIFTREKETVLIPAIKNVSPQKETSSFWSLFLSLAGIVVSVAIPFLAPEGLGFSLLAEGIAIGTDLGLQEASAKLENRDIDNFSLAFSLIGGGFAAASSIAAARALQKTNSALNEYGKISSDFSSLQKNVLQSNFEKLITKEASIQDVTIQLSRAGLTEERAIKEINAIVDISKRNGINVTRLEDELAFINRETEIFNKLGAKLSEYGIKIDDIFSTIRSTGIDFVGVKTSEDLIRTIRANRLLANELKSKELFKELEGALERDLDPTLFTRVLNAEKAEAALVKVNRVLSLTSPTRFVQKVAHKIFDPIKERVSDKVYQNLSKQFERKFKQLLRQDLVRKLETKNGVYPCFSSGPINYLRAIPVGIGKYKCLVIWRKWGYAPIPITPLLTLPFIIQWSESSSPGRIYHDFRREYGGPKGITSDSDATFTANHSMIFNLLGYIPSKYIRLGVSLIRNVEVTKSVIQQDAWVDFFKKPQENIFRPFEEKGIEAIGGKFAEATFKQSQGETNAIEAFATGRVRRITNRHRSEFSRSARQGKSRLASIKRLNDIIK